MILRITKAYDKSFTEDTVNLGIHMLQLQTTHLFIASNKWDEVYIELDDSVPENSLLHINLVTDNIKVKLPENVTAPILKQLTELFPDKAGALRRCFMTGQSMKGVLDNCLVS